MTFWRSAGVNYIKFSKICAQALRDSLKSDFKADAAKRIGQHFKVTQWKDGKAIKKET
ncbi:ATP synthase subunit epsilon mitochondrial [Fasciola gigantica]|uniref:ATP synthase subunit epsilon mitochondrial n=1 Tax=Fasciola gigantica TaxID=46835 RepID=A0A504YTS8_FASGI|nr:ATP synthase subunit epsilon mitochondrial [Fasciola gigantica]